MTQLDEITKKAKAIMQQYKEEYPSVVVDRDYFPFKITEEWGECLQAYLMLTDRGRQKGKNKNEIKKEFADEFADVFAFLLLFAERENINLEESIEKKWFSRLNDKKTIIEN